MNPADVLDLVAASMDRGTDHGLVHRAGLPARRAEAVEVPEDLPGVLRRRLERAGVTALWSHQRAALEAVRAGRSVAVATGTASGKTLCYQLPAIERLVADDRATVLYLAPTKALAHDQLRALRRLAIPQVRAAALDGDTERAEREAIRRTANWVLTNPDLLHHAMLPGHRTWAEFLHRLQVVVVDEAHVARGVFGGHVGLVLRRLRRLCERYGADPVVVCTSATIGNPAAHAEALTGLEVEPIVRDGSPRPPFTVGLWQPPLLEDADGGGHGAPARRSLLGEVADLLGSFVGAEVQTLAFTQSRKAAEVIALRAGERLTRDVQEQEAAARHGPTGTPLAQRVAAYRGGYLSEERRALERRLRQGELLGLVATNALELGIDVTGIDAVLLAGWPGTFASFHQRLGRAGRAGHEGVGVLVAGDDPLDQYLVNHPDELLARGPEDAMLDPGNPYLLGPHLRAACDEAPMDREEAAAWFGPSAPGLLEADGAAGRLRERGGRFHWTARTRAAREVDLRAIGGQPVRIVDTTTGAMVGDVDRGRAPRTVHGGAVYLHQGRRYEVAGLDLDRGIAFAEPDPRGTTTTRPRTDTDVVVLDELEAAAWTHPDPAVAAHGELGVALGRVEVTNRVVGYDVLRLGSDEVLARVDLDLPPQQLRTVAVWWTFPAAALGEAGLAPRLVPGSLHAAEHAAIGMLPLIALCDRWDLGGVSTALHADTGRPSVFVYDGVPGGAGLAERSYRALPRHLAATRAAIHGCRCHDGCPSCVQSPKCGNGNDPLDKPGAITVLDLLLAAAPT